MDESDHPYGYESEPDRSSALLFPAKRRLPYEEYCEEFEEFVENYNVERISALGIVEVNDAGAIWKPKNVQKAAPNEGESDGEETWKERGNRIWRNRQKKGTLFTIGRDTGNDGSVCTCYATICIVASRKGKGAASVWPKQVKY